MLNQIPDPAAIKTLSPHILKCDPVTFKDVSLKINGKNLIRNISCTLDTLGKTVVIGPNGAGKSLFLRLMTGLIKPTSGTISGGVDKYNDQKGQPIVCYSLVFQNPVLLRRSVYENIAFVLRQDKCPKSELADRVIAALKQARLENRLKAPARRLSGGEQQRLALARALVVNPPGLLLDEATASLDPASTGIVEKMIHDADAAGTKIVFVTHDVRQAKRLADDILFFDEGQILAHKPARDFFKDPGSDKAQAYLDGRIIL